MPAEPPIDTPQHLFEAYERLAAGPTRPIAGGTDIMVAITGELGEIPERMLDLSRIDALRGISLEVGGLVLGARTTYTEIRRSALCREHLPALTEAAATIGAAQIQNRGTLGGNIANASPAGDTLPILLAADAVILVGGQRGEREIAANDFFVEYRKTALAPDELILQVRFPLPPGRELRFRKVGTRRAQAISKVMMAGVRGDEVRLAVGAVGPTVITATGASTVLSAGGSLVAAQAALDAEIAPIDDLRSTRDYRRVVAMNLLAQFWSDTA
jgi:xanthine dehydrogenase small subunit